MKIRALRRRADALAEAARFQRLASRTHARRSWLIVRRRVGSPAGLAVSFSLGFLAGYGRRSGAGGRLPDQRPAFRQQEGALHRLIRGPLGESALKLISAMVAGFVMKYWDDEDNGNNEEQAANAAPAVH